MIHKKAYIYFLCLGLTYGTGRSWYWSDKLKEREVIYDSKLQGYKSIEHPLLSSDKLITTSLNLILGSTPVWPLLAFGDYRFYEKKEYGVNHLPFPYRKFELK